MCPEIYENYKSGKSSYYNGTAADIYSSGVSLFMMYTG
jgi:hypothetical protein